MLKSSSQIFFFLGGDSKKMLVDLKHAPYCARADLIATGYRREQKCALNALLTVFALHNETVNIWSHLIGAFLFCGLFAIELADLQPHRTLFCQFSAILAVAFFLSAMFHTFCSSSACK